MIWGTEIWNIMDGSILPCQLRVKAASNIQTIWLSTITLSPSCSSWQLSFQPAFGKRNKDHIYSHGAPTPYLPHRELWKAGSSGSQVYLHIEAHWSETTQAEASGLQWTLAWPCSLIFTILYSFDFKKGTKRFICQAQHLNCSLPLLLWEWLLSTLEKKDAVSCLPGPVHTVPHW